MGPHRRNRPLTVMARMSQPSANGKRRPPRWKALRNQSASRTRNASTPSAAGTITAKGGIRLPRSPGTQAGTTSPQRRTRPKQSSASSSETMLRARA